MRRESTEFSDFENFANYQFVAHSQYFFVLQIEVTIAIKIKIKTFSHFYFVPTKK